MISIVEHIEYLLMLNDCVVIPQWGAIIAQQQEPRFDRSRVTPAQRYFTFNAQVDHNDGLIANSIVRRHGLTYDQAMREISTQVTAMRRQLDENSVVPLGRLGFFGRAAGGRVVFTPFASQLALSDSYGLRAIVFKTLSQLEREQAAIDAFAAGERQRERGQRRVSLVRKSLRWAASIALLVCLGLVLTTHVPMGDDVEKASLALPAITAPATTATATEVEQEPAAPRFDEGMPDDADGRYILVIATLNSAKQVADFQAMARVKTATMPHGKMTYVYVAQSDDYTALVNAMKRLPAAHRQAYVTEAR